MDWPREESVVLCVAEADPAERLVEALEGLEVRDVSPGDARDALDALDRVGCVVIAGSFAGEGGVEFASAVRERDPDVPIVFSPAEGSEELAGRATAAGATYYVPGGVRGDALRDRVRDALEAFHRRRELRRKSTILDSMVAGFSTTFFAKDEEARHVMLSNPDGESSAEEAIGKTDLELYDDDPAHARRANEDDLQVIETGEPIVAQEEKIDARDYTAWNEVTKVPWRDEDGEIRGLVGVSRDITERKETEHELRRERARAERFANYIAHDLRNPLNVARGYLELARESGDVGALDEIESAMDRIEEVIEDVLALVGEDGPEPPLTQVRLHEPVQEAWETVDTRGAELSVAVPGEALVVAERSHLQEVFENLFRNAVEHGSAGPAPSGGAMDGGSDLTVRVGLLEDGFYVEDDGKGIPESEREAVLEYGYTPDDGGTGIGLSVVSELADVYDWEVEVGESASGGARFEFHDCLVVAHPPSGRTAGRRIAIDGHRDVGGPDPPGEAEGSGETWIVRGAGEDVWSDTHEFHLAYAQLDGDGRITARLTSLEAVEPYTKAGVTIRAGFEESDPLGYVGLTAEHGSETLWRPRESDRTGYVAIDAGAEPPQWLRAERVGDRVTLFVSTDGESWMPVDQREVDLGDVAYAGLLVCSHQNGTLAEAHFDEVAIHELDSE